MDNEIIRNLKYYVDLALRRPLLLILPAVAVTLIGLIVVLQMPRSYMAEAIIVVRSDQMPNALVASTVANERLQFIEQRVLARNQLLALVEKMNLFPDIRNSMSESRLAAMVRSHIMIIPLATEESQQYAGRSVFNVRFSYSDPVLAASVTSELVDMIIRENRSSRTATAADTSQFLEREVVSLSERLDEKDKIWRDFLEAHSNALPSRTEALAAELTLKEQELADVNRAIPQLDDEMRLLEAQYRWNAPLADTAAAARQQQLQELKTELATKSSTMSDAHPEIRSLQSRIQFLESQNAQHAASGAPVDPATLSPELGLIAERIDLAKPRREALVKQQEEASARVDWLRANIARSPEVASQMAVLERDRTAAQRSLEDMRAKLDTARVGLRLEEDHNADQIQIVEAPEAPRYPTEPARMKLMMMVLGLAAMVGAAVLYLADMLDKRIRGTFDLRNSLQGQALVVIPDMRPGNRWMNRLGLATPALAIALVSAAALQAQDTDPAQSTLSTQRSNV